MTIDLKKPGYYAIKDLGDDAARFYEEEGFLVVHDGVSADGVEELKQEAVAVCRQERACSGPSIRTTTSATTAT